MAKIYYNEIDLFCAEWLANLMHERLIPHGNIDTRSISDVAPDDLKSYRQCHFFAGIGGWAYALRLADFPADREVWTGSCPCQPFSVAGQARGAADERHLWPHWFHLVAQRKPATILGEQVASKAGLQWFDLVWTDLESAGYAVGVSDLGAAGVGAPHIRQRLWFVADSERHAAEQGRIAIESAEGVRAQAAGAHAEFGRRGLSCQLADGRLSDREGWQADPEFAGPSETCGLDDTASSRRIGAVGESEGETRNETRLRLSSERGAWRNLQWLPCTDGKARPVEPGTFPLAHGIPGRVGRLRAYGNAIVPQVAAEFVRAFLECRP